MQKNQRSNHDGVQRGNFAALEAARKKMLRQAALAGLLIIQLVVLVFAITAAWYTNIIQTNDLVFETSAWGFDGSIQLGAEPVRAAPGAEGVIPLTAVNESDEVTAVSINISKINMDEEMQKRIYFYADTGKHRNEEDMERIYLSNTGSYTYTMAGRETLTLTEADSNDVRLKWQWVYDLLGYYVLGVVTNDGAVITEYLRPIEYHYDEFRTTFDADGTLATIDGVTTTEEFLRQVSLSDGYDGTIDMTGAVGSYYPVDVDDNGYGVWAYLCNYNEIQQNTEYDTKLGSGEEVINNFTAKATIYAQNSRVETVEELASAEVRATAESGAAEGSIAADGNA